MEIVKPKVLVPVSEMDPAKTQKLERYARTCYKSEDKMKDGELIEFLINRGHESVIEHEKVTVMFVIDRGVSHELVRHRIAAYSQESTRYCNYSKDKFSNEATFIMPYFYDGRSEEYEAWKESCWQAEKNYLKLLKQGSTPQEARSVLPSSLKTEIVTTFNMREWRHFFKLRASKESHPQIRQVAIPLVKEFVEVYPEMFADIYYDYSLSRAFDKSHYADIVYTDILFNPLVEEVVI